MDNLTDHNNSPTKLSDASFTKCLTIVRGYLDMYSSIRNRDLRHVSGIGYDQAIYFFNRAISEGRLIRIGTGSGTRYTLPLGSLRS